eukprot:scaffold164680_cov15-Tisochrysis_lutea.AAC.1
MLARHEKVEVVNGSNADLWVCGGGLRPTEILDYGGHKWEGALLSTKMSYPSVRLYASKAQTS